MLANEVNEEFWGSQAEYQHAVLVELRAVLQEGSPLADEAATAETLNSRILGHLPRDEWQAVLSRLHPPREAAQMALQLIASAPPSPSSRSRPATPQLLAFHDFLQARIWSPCSRCSVRRTRLTRTRLQFLLRWHLDTHKKALGPIVEAFRMVDTARCGFLDEEQFSRFCRIINPAIARKEVGMLMATMDPHASGKVTFSSCAATLSRELTRIMQGLQLGENAGRVQRCGPGRAVQCQ